MFSQLSDSVHGCTGSCLHLFSMIYPYVYRDVCNFVFADTYVCLYVTSLLMGILKHAVDVRSIDVCLYITDKCDMCVILTV